MDDILRYENRDQLYQYLIKDFGFVIQEERYSPESFGNFFIELASNDFLLRYINDRDFLTIEIASHSDRLKWTDLSFVKNYINHAVDLNPGGQTISAKQRIDELNNFLKNNYELISDLFDRDNYKDTREKIDTLLLQSFDKRFPGMRQ